MYLRAADLAPSTRSRILPSSDSMSESFTEPVRDMNPATSSAMIDRTCADVSANLAENFCTRVCVSASLMPSRVAVDGRDAACGGSDLGN